MKKYTEKHTEENYMFTEGMAVGYGGRPLIRDISIQVKAGQIVTLIGPNGAGKSTILKTMIRQLETLEGRVCLLGRSMKDMDQQQTARSLSALMTERVRPERMTAREVAAMGRYPYTGRLGILSGNDWDVVDHALKLVHCRELADQDFLRLSDGQRQRILLARAICQEPKVMVLDEPASFLDIRHKLELLAVLKDLVKERKVAVLMSLHEIELAQRISDYVICVKGDRIHGAGTPEEIFRAEYIKELYGICRGSYEPESGFLELEAPGGEPEVFVIGGGGQGIPVYRRLQRQGIPFIAGILHKNDVEYPVARALAARVITEEAFEPIGEDAYEEAVKAMEGCRQVICCLKEFGTMNQANKRLAEMGKREGTQYEV